MEKLVYRLSGVDPFEEMSWLRYLWAVTAMTCVGFASLMAILMTQKWLPFNTQGFDNLSWHLAFNTAWSFTCNADWQSYSGESTMTYLSQTLGLSVHQFLSGAAGLAVLVAVGRAPVSYTHLDVYKRQLLRRPKHRGRDPVGDCRRRCG